MKDIAADNKFSDPNAPAENGAAGNESETPVIREQERAFTMHRNLLRDVIEKQAGSLDKAVIEAVMNLIEAGASEGRITLSETLLTIGDDGRGFQSEGEILESFEVFGKSDERKQIAGKWAEFQMGRGQLMAFGKTTYRSGKYEMIVDFRSCPGDIKYSLREHAKSASGCLITVELYNSLTGAELAALAEDIRRNVKYVEVPIYFNGNLISSDPKNLKWDGETAEAYFKIGGSQVELYNLGIFVKASWTARHAVGVRIVSKKKLSLNFARNDVLSSCPVWKTVAKKLKEMSKEHLLKYHNPSEDEIRGLIFGYFNDEISIDELLAVNLFRDTNNKRWSIEKIIRENWGWYSFDGKGSVRADQVMQRKMALIFDEEFCRKSFFVVQGSGRRFPYSEVIETIFREVSEFHDYSLKPAVLTELYRQMSGMQNHLIIEEQNWNDKEKMAIAVLRQINVWIARRFDLPERQILLGRSDLALAWTNGTSFIAFDRKFLEKNVRTGEAWTQILLTLAHEYAHTDREGINHDDDFYERYHDYSYKFLLYLDDAIKLHLREAKRRRKHLSEKFKTSPVIDRTLPATLQAVDLRISSRSVAAPVELPGDTRELRQYLQLFLTHHFNRPLQLNDEIVFFEDAEGNSCAQPLVKALIRFEGSSGTREQTCVIDLARSAELKKNAAAWRRRAKACLAWARERGWEYRIISEKQFDRQTMANIQYFNSLRRPQMDARLYDLKNFLDAYKKNQPQKISIKEAAEALAEFFRAANQPVPEYAERLHLIHRLIGERWQRADLSVRIEEHNLLDTRTPKTIYDTLLKNNR